MARGWESKAIEDQMAAAEARREGPREPSISDADREGKARRQLLSLSRARVLQDLQLTCNAHRRAQLEAALADIDEALRGLG